MEFVTIMVIAVGLAMDAFTVSIVSGSAYKQLHLKHALQMALFFGAFQAFMPLVGALAGLSVKEHITGWDHWVAFALLAGVGAKMIYESLRMKPEKQDRDPTNILVLLALSIATSIDALAVGITLSLLVTSLAIAVAIIGLVTFILCYLGVCIGKKFGHFFESKIEALGGLILIALGLKILARHLLFQ